MTAYFTSREAVWNWTVGPASRPRDLAEKLLSRGFTHSHNVPGMAIDLASYTPGRADSSVKEVVDEACYGRWLEALTAAFGMPHEVSRSFAGLGALAGSRDAPFRCFYAEREGEMVSTGMTFEGAGVAGIYCIGTLPSARRQGYGEKIMRACLAAAVEDRHTAAILHSSSMGLPLYEKLGFSRGCTLSYYNAPATVE